MKTKSFKCIKNSTRGFLKNEFDFIENTNSNINNKDKCTLNAHERKILEMNPKIKLEEIKKVQADNKEFNRLNTESEKIINNNNNNLSSPNKQRPMTSKLLMITQSQSNIFNSDVS
jgi:hypothetical protein